MTIIDKEGIMCTECEKVYWNAIEVKKCMCGDTDPNHRTNVSVSHLIRVMVSHTQQVEEQCKLPQE